jgi:hypothetical protein
MLKEYESRYKIIKMKVKLSFLSKMRTFIGLEIGHSGYLKRNDEGHPMLVRTIELSLGFLFGWISFEFESGRQVDLDDINKSLREEVLKGKKIE